jgi:hypothetical protein
MLNWLANISLNRTHGMERKRSKNIVLGEEG